MANMWRTVSVILMCLGQGLLPTDGFSIHRPHSPLLRMLKRPGSYSGCAELNGRAASDSIWGRNGTKCNSFDWTCADGYHCSTMVIPCVTEDEQTVTMNYKTWHSKCVTITEARFLQGPQMNIVYPASRHGGEIVDNTNLLYRVQHSQKQQVHLTVTRENGNCYVPKLELKGHSHFPCGENTESFST